MEIIKLPIEYGKEIVDSRFRLVLACAQRARQLSEGSVPLVKNRYVKNTTIALDEAVEDKLKYLVGEEARRARDYEHRMRRERMARESMEEAAQASLDKMSDIKEAYKAETASAVRAKAELEADDLEGGDDIDDLDERYENDEDNVSLDSGIDEGDD